MNTIKAIIDEIQVEVPAGTSIMAAADTIGSHVPRLCYHPFLSTEGACRICIVEIEGKNNFTTSCHTQLEEGMVVRTNSSDLRLARRDLIELLLDNHPRACLTCDRDGNCELQNLSYKLGVRERLYEGERKRFPTEKDNIAICKDSEKCILCRRCVRACSEIQGVYNLSQMYRGFNTVVGPAFDSKMDESVCIMCGQCINVCPTAAFVEKGHYDKVWDALNDPTKHVVVQTAPSIRVAIGEGWYDEIGIEATRKSVTALRRLGFDAVFDTNFGADLTIMEESTEFLKRFEKGENLPILTSCSPGWISFMEHFYPEFIPNASTCKSPMQMTSTLIKTYYAKQKGIDPKDVYVVAIMPCVAKKYEAGRPEHYAEEGYPYTDAVLTTRELIWMIKAMGIDFKNLPDGEFDSPMGESTGAAVIFGSTGGVMEATLRTAYTKLTGKKPENLEFTDVRAVEGLRESTVEINGTLLNVAVANGLSNARKILEKVKSGEKQYHIIELMACPGGCISGGGQPLPHAGQNLYPLDPIITEKRRKAIYQIDTAEKMRVSSDNPSVKKLYKEFLKKPGSEIAHELLHTHYSEKFPRGVK